MIEITFDLAKRRWTLEHRGLDFADSVEVFAEAVFEFVDKRRDYGEVRHVTAGLLRGRLMIVVWTPRGHARHVISMRKANDREKARFGQRLGEK